MSNENNPLIQLMPNVEDVTASASDQPLTVENFDIELHSLDDLARIDTSSVDELKNRHDAYISKMKEFVLDDAEGIRALLDYIDSRIGGDRTVDHFDLAAVRDSVRGIMVTLKMHPEYNGILLDEDIGNIVAFARETHRAALETNELARIKAASKPKRGSTPKAAAKQARFEKNLANLNNALKGLHK